MPVKITNDPRATMPKIIDDKIQEITEVITELNLSESLSVLTTLLKRIIETEENLDFRMELADAMHSITYSWIEDVQTFLDTTKH